MISRRVLAGLALLGLLATVAVIQLRGEETPSEALVADTASVEGPGASAQGALSAPAGASRSDPNDTFSVCERLVDEVAAYATKVPLNEEQSRIESSNLLRRLSGTRDPELFLTRLLLAPPVDPASRKVSDKASLIDLGARGASSGFSLLAWHALRTCADAGQDCPFTDLEPSLLAADQQNAEAWALVATMRHRRGDVAGALAAMQGAASASTSTWYWTDTIALIERSLSTQTAIAYPDRIREAFGVAVAVALPPQPDLLNMCKVEAAASRLWGEACLAFGTLRSVRNETLIARSIAGALREQAHVALGDTKRAADVAKERAMNRASTDRAGMRLAVLWSRLQQALFEQGPAQLHAFLGDVQQFGELEGGRRFLRRELPPVLERSRLLERDGASECFARFLDR